ncbi:MAG: DEAD/DEAH box helicase [Planctomycetes bacterium]|nr:DEAD/DEAH box helicase [Planctomycetota bacterium]
MTFSELNLCQDLVNALKDQNIHEPTAIQEIAIPKLAAGENAYVSSHTGSGKTLAYLLPILNTIEVDTLDLQCLIIVPTHELAVQIGEQIKALSVGKREQLRHQLLMGEAAIKRQKERLKKKPHIVIGTPGRLLELSGTRKLKLHKLKQVVIDEADKLLYDKFLETTQKLCAHTPKIKQSIFVSATSPNKSLAEVSSFCDEFSRIESGANEINPQITHIYIQASKLEKPEKLRQFLQIVKGERSLIFFHRNGVAKQLAEKLIHHGLKVAEIHGDIDKMERKKNLEHFKKGKIDALISSDIAARGLHVDNIENIINYDMPAQSNQYLHRAGRTGRGKSEGHCISFISRHELDLLEKHEDVLNIKIQEASMKDGEIYALKENKSDD